MPRVEPTEFESLSLDAFRFVAGFELHDVWRVDLPNGGPLKIADLRGLFTPEHRRSVNPVVRGLFRLDPEGAWTTLEEQPHPGLERWLVRTLAADRRGIR